jgi:hypothetical protein
MIGKKPANRAAQQVRIVRQKHRDRHELLLDSAKRRI